MAEVQTFIVSSQCAYPSSSDASESEMSLKILKYDDVLVHGRGLFVRNSKCDSMGPPLKAFADQFEHYTNRKYACCLILRGFLKPQKES